jgi:glycosyltransferase involved in cell wall biosynthesis
MNANGQKLAVLIPVYNGGERLLASLRSCAMSGMPATEYEIVVVDNCSTDGAADHLPALDANGAVVRVYRSSSNIGRVANWNRCLEIALAGGFEYVAFLFAGDEWISGNGLADLFHLMLDNGASIGFSPFLIADDEGRVKRASQRFYTSTGGTALTSSRRFMQILISSGLFPLGPIQANIYRITREPNLRFNESLPTVTDVRATLDFIRNSERNIVISPTPFLKWREHKGRFHATMGVAQTMRDYFETFHAACESTGIPVDYGRAKARLMLNCARLIAREGRFVEWPQLLLELLRNAARSPYRSSVLHMFEVLWLRFALRRRLLMVA